MRRRPLGVVLTKRPVLIVAIAGVGIDGLAVGRRDDGFVVEDGVVVPIAQLYIDIRRCI